MVEPEAPRREGGRRWVARLKAVVGLALLAVIAVYVYRHADMLSRLPALSVGAWAAIVALTAGIGTTSVLAVQRMLNAVGAGVRFGEMFLLHNAAYLLNLLPAKAGTVLRATYLKRRHDFSFARFGVFAVGLTLLTVLVSSAIGLASLLTVYGLDSLAGRVFAALLAASVTASALLLLVPLPTPRWSGRLGGALREFVASRGELVRRPRALLGPGAWLLCGYLLTTARLGVIYQGVGLSPHLGGLLLLGALGQVSTVVNLTPGGLGVRELLLGGGAAVLGVPVEVGLLVALIERSVGLVWSVVVGIPSAVWVWRRQAD
ncbi:MAG TPA: lysylphosphatidylglycerol synthase domain-containing protein [Thermoanaerobaculia bacterium]|nr:lysylphosphatidylglycerol synthase domain-containing protein [Thermoanaerobaculia bacterium]